VPWNLDLTYDRPENADVLAYLRREHPSAHDDAAYALEKSARGMPDVREWCPSPQEYAFVALATQSRRVFALARGMQSIVLALPAEEHAAALAAGARPCPEIGARWLEWLAFAGHDLARWCKTAHDHAARADVDAARGRDARTRGR
jgi:hypothetical protein